MENRSLPQTMEAIANDITLVQASIESLQVVDEESSKQATTYLSQLKSRVARVEELRTFFVKPLNDQVKSINAAFKPYGEKLKELDGGVRIKLKKYMDEQAAIAAEEARKMREEQEAKEKEAREESERLLREAEAVQGEEKEAKIQEAMAVEHKVMQEAKPLPKVETTLKSDQGSVNRRMVWKWKVTDLALLMKEHPELFMLDEKQVNTLVRTGTRELPGIEIYQESTLAVK